jgi:hypothetical protein
LQKGALKTMDENLLTWSVRNWITVFLMVLLGWAILGTVARLVRGKRGSKVPSASDTASGAYAAAG